MNSKFDLKFWKKDYVNRFGLNREAEEILDYFINSSPEKAEEYIKDKYTRQVYRGDIIDTYCSKYNENRINKLLHDLDYEPLTKEEIENYEISEQKETEEFE